MKMYAIGTIPIHEKKFEFRMCTVKVSSATGDIRDLRRLAHKSYERLKE